MCNRNPKWKVFSVLLSIIYLLMIVLPAGATDMTSFRYWRNYDLAPSYYWDKIEEMVAEQDVEALMQKWEEEYGHFLLWPLEYQAIRLLQSLPASFSRTGGEINFSPEAAPFTLYGFPASEDISREEAIEIAQKAFFAACEGIYEKAYAESLKVRVSFILNVYSYGSRTWLIFFDDTETEGVTPGLIDVDAITGDVVNCSVGNGVG